MNSPRTSIRMGCSRFNFRIEETKIWWLLKIIYTIFYNKIIKQICHIFRTLGMWPIYYNTKYQTPTILPNQSDRSSRTSRITSMSSHRCKVFQFRLNHLLQVKWPKAIFNLMEIISQNTSFLVTRILLREILNKTLLTSINNNLRPFICRIESRKTWIDNTIEAKFTDLIWKASNI